MPLSTELSPAAIALNRFGLGATPAPLPGDPRQWLAAQFDRFETTPPAFAALPDARAMLTAYQEQQRALRKQAPPPAPGSPMPPGKTPEQKLARRDFGQDVRALYGQAVQARTQSALTTPAPFVERMVHFWSNHFCVSADDIPVTAFAGAFERDAIRPHVLGRFEDMVLAVERHPAMLMYLNQNQSIGPNSPAALRAQQRGGNPRKQGLNENLAREIMELHTLGVRSGYTQADVTEFARAMTGWTIGGPNDDAPGDFAFHPQQHEPGTRMVLGKAYAQQGMDQARAVMADFAHAPATATHVATKLARHFAGDNAPPSMVTRMANVFQTTRGDLPSLYKALIESPEAWQSQPLKAKTPWEWTVSALRALGRNEPGALQMAAIQQQLGQPVWKPGSPAGWDDTAASWIAPDALMRRVEFAQRLVAPLATQIDARRLAPQVLPGALTPATQEQIAHAETPASALALMLVSPDFLRR
ncbi:MULTISPECIES: DUF1800 domain-containing protein [unclassified Sphingomonas]|uniref:DUF1800 domain-containing protein n=1 Tax=Novosphingobium rhizosphaerae TaxID=1551649 RepID=UPI0015CA6EE2